MNPTKVSILYFNDGVLIFFFKNYFCRPGSISLYFFNRKSYSLLLLDTFKIVTLKPTLQFLNNFPIAYIQI